MTSSQTTAAQLYHQLHLEIQHILEAMSYDQATSFCHDCPLKNWDDYEPQSYHELEFGVQIADSCCKDDPDYNRANYEHIDFCQKLMEQLKTLAGEEELTAAQSKVAQK